MPHINVIGAGLAGCEAAHQAARLGCSVTLYEMKPHKKSPAHKSNGFAELVCSNSLRSEQIENAVGLLKKEMEIFDSIIMEAAHANAVPAGSALAVDREKFSRYITDKITNNPLITVKNEEITSLPDDEITVIATGPLTSDSFSAYIKENLAPQSLHFFDAAAPIVDRATINTDIAFLASRYGKGEACYYNCPMTKEEYDVFYNALISAREAELHDFDKESQKDLTVFEGCMPVEVMAKRGYDTLLYGPLKPVGLPLPSTGKEAFAVVQLRAENAEGTMYNLVGFQTHLAFEEQRRVFRLIPGLENAEFLRYGVMHRNTYLNSPGLLGRDYSLKSNNRIFFAGQMTGVEGYVESSGSGLVAGINSARLALGQETLLFPVESELGCMARYVSCGTTGSFQPMNANFGIIEPLGYKVKGGKAARNAEYAKRSIQLLTEFKEKYSI
ncbi:MAG: methylenetetrahydrofolate--tRNA-(uracil(54)-C(5))-methyltransferase (FADH(2)-oxidizing) TrmFO [Ruminococcaceae bacterium]|nr:methylenetetrahydrofolate--tRNA-(uracil(54)-C(5))-methyltransferase (FADH(2)-oxidizing) TrmFO [Oscillospiraceae bacterium]